MDLVGKVGNMEFKKKKQKIFFCRNSNHDERNMAINTGLKFIEEKNLSKNTRITKVFMGGEPDEFKSLFLSWN